MRLSLGDAIGRYGPIVNGIWANESKWCDYFNVPPYISKFLLNSFTKKPTERIYVNKDLMPLLQAAFSLIESGNIGDQLHTFDGCLHIRNVRGEPGKLSCHSYACAIDINASENRLGFQPTLSIELVGCFKSAGFSWGGEFQRKDGMHFSSAWE